MPGGAHVPRLDEVLDLAAASDALVVTEVKAGLGSRRTRTAALLADHLDRRGRRNRGVDRVITSSFDPLSAGMLAGHGIAGGGGDPRTVAGPRRVVGWARGCGLTELHLSVEHVRRDPVVVADLHAAGVAVAAGIVGHPEEAARLARLGVDMLCTDAVARVGPRRAAVVPARTAAVGVTVLPAVLCWRSGPEAPPCPRWTPWLRMHDAAVVTGRPRVLTRSRVLAALHQGATWSGRRCPSHRPRHGAGRTESSWVQARTSVVTPGHRKVEERHPS